MTIRNFLKNRSPLGLYTISIAILGLLYTMHFVTPKDLSLEIFYLVPLAIVAWYCGYWQGLSIALLSTVAWYFTEGQVGALYSVSGFVYWNAFVRLIYYAVIVYLLNALHKKLIEQEQLAITDSLTGALNTRGFLQRVEAELERARRYNFACTLAYIDLDNFKNINDNFGHSVGDAVLKELVVIMHEHTRASDIVGRLGGDEFAIFYPELDANAAMQAIHKLLAHVKERAEKSKWPVYISIGMITVDEGACELSELIKKADNLMYTVKGDGKNNVCQATYPNHGILSDLLDPSDHVT